MASKTPQAAEVSVDAAREGMGPAGPAPDVAREGMGPVRPTPNPDREGVASGLPHTLQMESFLRVHSPRNKPMTRLHLSRRRFNRSLDGRC
eukprot:6209653-Pleurochrysis_carterae.AAC.7